MPFPIHCKSALSILCLLGLLLAGTARAQNCGQTLTHDLRFDRDLHCDSGWTALTVAAPGLSIDLNGHTLSGSRALVGISLYDVHSVEIRGPGVIRGFWAGVNGLRADGLEVQGLLFEDVGSAIVLAHSDSVRIENNTVLQFGAEAIALSAPLAGHGSGRGGHVIAGNLIAKGGSGIVLCGAGQGRSLLLDNRLQQLEDYGIHLLDGSDGHRIHGNRMGAVGNTGLLLRGSSGNEVLANRFDSGRIAMALVPADSARCDPGASDGNTKNNHARSNRVLDHVTGVLLGNGGDKQPRVTGNWVHQNRLERSDLGVFLRPDAHANNARGNVYPGTTEAVIDEGVDNRW